MPPPLFKLLPEFLESCIRLNGSHFGHSTVSLIHGNFSRQFLFHLLLFGPNFWNFWLESVQGYQFSLTMVLRCAREARGSSAKTTITNKKKFEYYSSEENVWQCRGYTRLETTAIFFSFCFSFFLFSSFLFERRKWDPLVPVLLCHIRTKGDTQLVRVGF